MRQTKRAIGALAVVCLLSGHVWAVVVGSGAEERSLHLGPQYPCINHFDIGTNLPGFSGFSSPRTWIVPHPVIAAPLPAKENSSLTFGVGEAAFAVSREESPPNWQGGISGHARVSPFNAWIDGMLGMDIPASRDSSFHGRSFAAIPDTGRTAEAVPEPGVMGLLTTAAVLLLVPGLVSRRRGRRRSESSR